MADDHDLESRWRSWLLARNRRGMRGVLWIMITLYPLFGALDYLTGPREWLWLLWGTRLVVTLVTLVMFRVASSGLFERHLYALSASYIVLLSAGISLMTVFMGGLASPYYAGLSLAILGTGLLFVWPPRVVVATHATVVATFIVANVAMSHVGDLLTAVSNLFFLVSTAIIAGTGQILAYRSQREQLENQLIIEQTKESLQNAHDQLKQLDRFKSEFFANITHELKTPLTMMLAPLELLIDGELGNVSEAQRSTFQSMLKSGMKLLRLIGDLLDLSKLEESRLRLRVEQHDLVAYLRSLLAQVEVLAQRKGLKLVFDTDVERCDVWCDLERMERIFINLLSNANKFTPPGGTVSVRLRDEGEAVRVEVRDTGIGFPQEMAEKLFRRFFQVDMAGTRKFGGTGIGLALAKELLELHGGQIEARGEPGVGASFSVRLLKDREHFSPDVLDRRAARAERHDGQRASDRGLADLQVNALDRFRLIDIDEATEQRVVERDPDEDLRRYSVLVVEDTPDIIRVIRLALHHDFRVLAASDGARGFDLAIKHRPTLIITDLMMPEVDGLELTRRLRADARTKHTPIVMLTARGAVEDRVTGLQTGVNAYLAKPFAAKELVSTVRSLLASQEATADILLTQRMDSLETIAGGLAHEILNPLNYVKNAMGLVQSDLEKVLAGGSAPDITKLRKLFDVAETGVRRIAGTVDLMMRYSREGYSREPQPHDVFAAIRDIVGLVLPTVTHRVEAELELEGDGSVHCVPEELNQALTNLIQNGLEAVAADGSGRLEIRATGDARGLTLWIKDNGVGIAPEAQARIFSAFYTTKDVGRGMGMGLTIAYRVVSALKGTINVSSNPGAGSEFVLWLPRGNERLSSAPAPAPRAVLDEQRA
jgi:signal transduction histidine kinase